MISRRQLPELRAFARAESELPFRTAPEYASLVIPNGNSAQRVHQWFKYKEAFSADLLEHVLDQADISVPARGPVRLLDLIRYAGVEKERSIGSHDALVAACCLECALENDERVTFCVENWTLYDIIRNVSAYEKVLRFHFIGKDKSKPKPKP